MKAFSTSILLLLCLLPVFIATTTDQIFNKCEHDAASRLTLTAEERNKMQLRTPLSYLSVAASQFYQPYPYILNYCLVSNIDLDDDYYNNCMRLLNAVNDTAREAAYYTANAMINLDKMYATSKLIEAADQCSRCSNTAEDSSIKGSAVNDDSVIINHDSLNNILKDYSDEYALALATYLQGNQLLDYLGLPVVNNTLHIFSSGYFANYNLWKIFNSTKIISSSKNLADFMGNFSENPQKIGIEIPKISHFNFKIQPGKLADSFDLCLKNLDISEHFDADLPVFDEDVLRIIAINKHLVDFAYESAFNLSSATINCNKTIQNLTEIYTGFTHTYYAYGNGSSENPINLLIEAGVFPSLFTNIQQDMTVYSNNLLALQYDFMEIIASKGAFEPSLMTQNETLISNLNTSYQRFIGSVASAVDALPTKYAGYLKFTRDPSLTNMILSLNLLKAFHGEDIINRIFDNVIYDLAGMVSITKTLGSYFTVKYLLTENLKDFPIPFLFGLGSAELLKKTQNQSFEPNFSEKGWIFGSKFPEAPQEFSVPSNFSIDCWNSSIGNATTLLSHLHFPVILTVGDISGIIISCAVFVCVIFGLFLYFTSSSRKKASLC